MKKSIPYILGALLAIVILVQIFAPRQKKVSTYISFNKKDKNPYGAYVFYEGLKKFFPRAETIVNRSNLFTSKSLQNNHGSKLIVIYLPFFEPDNDELEELVNLANKGHHIFISTIHISNNVKKAFKISAGYHNMGAYPAGITGPDTMQVFLSKPVFNPQNFTYPGKFIEGDIQNYDTSITRIMGHGDGRQTNFIQLRKGNGTISLHLSPLAFSNYFLLYENNIQYLEKIFSTVPQNTRFVIWDEYFRKGERTSGKSKINRDWLTTVMKNPYFKAGILLALATLLLYTLLEMRRKQRPIPVIAPPVNDSLDFVKTVGLLYYEKGDHTNLAQKMSTYFLEHIRSNYKIFSQKLDDAYIKEISYKSGVAEALVASIIYDVKNITGGAHVSEERLMILQKNMEEFYSYKS